MNYYERHMGDYARDTGHLTMLEHGAYTLILDRYYSTEQGIPADQAHRVARARTKDERLAVDSVLQEFFKLVEGVWIKNRVQEVIAKFHESAPDREAKKENGKERQRRSRERRKRLFESLRAISVVPPWDTKTCDLEAALSLATKAPVTPPVTPPVTRYNTATQSPIPNPQSPDLNTNTNPSPRQNSARQRGDDEIPCSPAQWVEVFAEQHGVDVDHRSFHDRQKFWPLATAWSNAGITVGQMRAACARSMTEAKEPIAWLPAYADRVLASMRARPQPTATESFAQRDASDGRRRWEEMTGEVHPENKPKALAGNDWPLFLRSTT